MIIGVTGTSGSGKSIAVNYLEEKLGCASVNADRIAYEMLQPTESYYDEVVKCFGKEILNDNKTINRKKLGGIIFNDNAKKDLLNKITENHVITKIKNIINRLETIGQANGLVLLDAPLLYEFSLQKMCKYVITIKADDNVKIDRIIKRDNLTQEQALARVNSQKEYDEINSKADYIVENNSTEKILHENLIAVIDDIARRENITF